MNRLMKSWNAFRLAVLMGAVIASAHATIPPVVMSDHQTMYTTTTYGAYGVAANTRGDVFFADFANNSLDMIQAGSFLPATPIILLTGMNSPQQVTVDKSGNVYVADQMNGQIYRVPFVSGAYPTNIAVSTFNSPTTGTMCAPGVTTDCRLTPITLYTNMRFAGVAVDGSGNVYIAEIYDSTSTGSNVKLFKQTTAGVTTNLLTTNLPGLTGGYTNAQLASDSAGNLYYTDQANLYSIPSGATSGTIQNSSTLTNPSGVTIDPNTGNLIVSDYGHTRIVVIPNESGTLNFTDQYMLAPYQTRSCVGVDAKGTIYYSQANGSPSAIGQMQISTFGVPSLAVGASSTVAYVYTTFNAASTVLNNYATSNNGGSITYSAGTCLLGTTYTVGQSCAYNIKITPSRVGPVSGTIMDTDVSGNVFAQFTLTANANGSAVAIDPGTVTSIGSGYSKPAGVAVDKAGNVFVADTTANTVYELVGGIGTPVSLGSGLSGPTGVAVDASGNLFIADTGNSRVVEIPVKGTALVTANQIVIASGLTAPLAIATGPLNLLYIAQSGSLASYANRGYSVPVQTAVISTAYTSPRSLAVDPSGNIFVADSSVGKLDELKNYTYATTNIATGLTMPTGLVTDAAGDLFLIDNGTSQAVRISNLSGTLTYAQATSVGSIISPYGVGIDELGNLYVSSSTVPALYQMARTTGSLSYGYVTKSTTSPVMNAYLVSAGNTSLTLGSPYSTASGNTAYFTQTGATTCTASGSLNSGSSCVIASTFSPTAAGAETELLTLSAVPTVITSPFNLTLTGTGTNPAAGIAVNGGGTQTATVNTAFTAPLAVLVTDSSSNPVPGVTVTYSVPGSGQPSATLSSNTAVTGATGIASVTATANTVASVPGAPYTVTASVSGVSGTANFSLLNAAGAATTFVYSSGSNQSATVNTNFTNQLKVRVKDQYGNGVPSVWVNFSAPGSGATGTFTSPSITGGTGYTNLVVTACTTAGGPYTVTATVSGLTGSVPFSLTNVAGTPAHITMVSGSSQYVEVNNLFALPLVAKVTDTYSNPTAGIAVVVTPPGSGASARVASGSTTTDNNGQVSLTMLANGTTGTNYSVVATTAGVSGNATFTLNNTAKPSSTIAQLYVDPTQTPTYPIQSNFVGFSLGQSEVQTLIGYQQTYLTTTISMNPIFENLIGNLQTIAGGPMRLRMLGDGRGPNTLKNSIPILNQLYSDKSATYFMGIDFVDYAEGNGISYAQGEVQNIFSTASNPVGLTPASMVALELNNEPDGYGNGTTPPVPGYTYAIYEPEAQSFMSTLLPYAKYGGTGTQYLFSAPVFMGYVTSWNAAGFVSDNAADLSMFNFHYYGGSNCTSGIGSVTAWQTSNPGLSYLLSSSALTFGLNNLQPGNTYLSNAIANAKTNHLPTRAGEMNSVACSGAFGMSDNFTSAIWAMDMGMTYAAGGVDGINFFLNSSQTYTGGVNSGSPAYNAFDVTYTTTNPSRTWAVAYVAPEYYGMMMLEYMLQNTAGVIPLSINSHSGNFSAWATKDASNVTRVLLLNKENGSNNSTIPYNGNVELVLPGHGAASVTSLVETTNTTVGGVTFANVNTSWWNSTTQAPNAVPAVTGIKINNQTFDGSTNGLIQGTYSAPSPITPVNGTYTVSVPVGNVVILTIP